MTKISKRSLVSGIIILLLVMTYSFLFCLYSFMLNIGDNFPAIITEGNRNLMWVTYGFTMGIFAIAFVASVLAFERKDLRSRVFGVPIVIIGYVGIVIQLVIDLILMVVGMWVKFPQVMTIIVLVPEVLLTIFIVLTIIIRQAYRGLVIEPIQNQEEKQSYIKELRNELKILCQLNQIESLDRRMNKIYEDALYADPVSSEEIEGIEDNVTEAVRKLKIALTDGNKDDAKTQIDAIEAMLLERKIRAKASKK